ncbi:MAG: inositol monophosphatase family protein [bacterium]|nr:inositol monophosphatase family protein [bacterium]
MSDHELLHHAITAAIKAGEILRSGFGSSMDRRSKSGRHNLVTEYDVRCEETIIDHLRANTPDACFLGEEGGSQGVGALQWVIDPLDGTVNFAHGIPIFCVSIAAVRDGVIVCGVIHHPLLQEMFTVVRGAGAFLNGKRLQVSTTPAVDDGIFVTGFPYNVMENPNNCIEQFASMVGRGIPIRRLGSAALDLAYLAAGRFDGYWEVELHPWDMAAGVLMVVEAGGTVSHYSGTPFVLRTDSIVATNGILHKELISILDAK